MSQEFQAVSERKEAEPQIAFQRPLGVDLFYAGDGNENNLPPSVLEHPRLLAEAAQRRELYTSLGDFFTAIPDPRMDVSVAMREGLVTPDATAGVYSKLCNFLETDENNARLILYLPSQLLPDRRVKKESSELEESESRFAESYKDAWINLLFERDMRANFVDGDIREIGMIEPLCVRKAAHLLPDMVEKGLVTKTDVTKLLTITESQELLGSIVEGVEASRRKNVLTEDEYLTLRDIASSKVVYDQVIRATIVPTKETPLTKAENSLQLVQRFDDALGAVELLYAADSPYVASISPARVAWEQGVKRSEVIEEAATVLSRREREGNSLESVSDGSAYPTDFMRVQIRAVMKVGEAYADSHPARAEVVATSSLDFLRSEWEKADPLIRDEIATCLSHWVKRGILSADAMTPFGIAIPDLSLPFAADTEKRLEKELREFSAMTAAMASNPELAQSLYPSMLLFGSRVKGYAGELSDCDQAVFVRPEVPITKRDDVLSTLHATLSNLEHHGKTLEYWMRESDGKIIFRPQPENRSSILGALQIQFLLGGIWVGESAELRQIQDTMMERYVDLSRMGDGKKEARRYLLRALEHDQLLFRLAHKGYRKYYPDLRDSEKAVAHEIDGNSDFWDPGYRRVATQLFVSRVFLPDLS